MSSSRPEETAAIERCIRSFIIKSIQAIVQARSGAAYATTCISDVGARNNLMVYLEEDPEIGATIKQNLDSGFPIKMGDTFSLEILMSNGAGGLVVLEVWQFRLDTEDNLLRRGHLPCSKVIANHSGLQPPIYFPTVNIPTASSAATAVSDATIAAPHCFAVEDFRRSRLFERLASLLKSLLVTTRMLPAYTYSRKPQHEMCYALRRGEVSLDRLGHESVVCRQVGHLFPGLAVGPNSTHLFLNVSVRYRGNLNDIESEAAPQPLLQPQPHRPRSRRLCIRPAFAATLEDDDDYLEEEDEEEEDEDEEKEGQFTYRIDKEGLPQGEGEAIYDETTGCCYYYYHDDPENSEAEAAVEGAAGCEEDEGGSMSRTFVSENVDRETGAAGDGSECAPGRMPLHLPFSTVDLDSGAGGGCARMAHLVTELRTKTDLDLFRVPGASVNPAPSSATASVFDANALGDELARHEQKLREFDDFLAEFTAAVPNVGITHH
ncbi:cell adhesion molecule [Echinococcus granulosus]|uniref:Cell adhesion molecule n=1 Tax=Echinococcus granulosus TaxID=6210 RepID=U6J416_ECHGR|nr:cell adhesion molecule [Echinococcus granulosus]EUB54743.1 cell adhesion molecule [Echinococcus granulosus]CDS16417.1 cell adhesion molecule [Echinococcus granulosus]